MSEAARFPADFLWGVATSAYQIEGHPTADGAGPGIWHEFSHRPGTTANGHTGDTACDHYHRYAGDIELVKQLGIGAYRFSIAWGRVLPKGKGRANTKGVAFYDRLVDLLLENGITPFVTLYHWDLPQALETQGGWLNDDVAHWFGEFASLAGRSFGDRIPFWATLNEPAIITEKAYVLGVYAPGHREPAEAPVVSRNLLRAHGIGVQATRAAGCRQVGIVVNLQPKYPASTHPNDVASARRADAFRNRMFLDPILLGRWPDEAPEMFGDGWRPPSDSDLELVRQRIDFVGVNYYTRNIIRYDPASLPTRGETIYDRERPRTLMGWEIYPGGLAETLLWVRARYGEIPLYVTENGAAFADPAPDSRGVVADPDRVAFLRSHLESALQARAAGVDLRGYFVWSLLDNFEWSSGYTRPFGIVHVDFETQKRTLKTSARYYSEVIRTGTHYVEI